MFMVTMAAGSEELDRRGVLVTHLNASDDAANTYVLCADKAGTLTMNQLAFVRSLAQPGFGDHDVVASSWSSNGCRLRGRSRA